MAYRTAAPEQLLRGRVCGHGHDDPNLGPFSYRTFAGLVGGPLDGRLLDVHGWRSEEVDDGVAVALGLPGGHGGRALRDATRAPACLCGRPWHRVPLSAAPVTHSDCRPVVRRGLCGPSVSWLVVFSVCSGSTGRGFAGPAPRCLPVFGVGVDLGGVGAQAFCSPCRLAASMA
ncbi:hypothetical protein [Streptomyces sp. NPDC004788]